MNARQALLAFAGGAFLAASTAEAQIIATSIPRDTTLEKAQTQRFRFHLMLAPLAKWRINTVTTYYEQCGGYESVNLSMFRASPYSDFLIAGEETINLGKGFTLGIGGWHNHVGTTTYAFRSLGWSTLESPLDTFTVLDGQADADLSYSEVHANVFYRYFGIQAGRVLMRRTLGAIRVNSAEILLPNGEGYRFKEPHQFDKTYANALTETQYDYDVFGVVRVGPVHAHRVRLTASVGAGIYHWDMPHLPGATGSPSQTVFSGFANLGVELYKGFSLDASVWYIAKTKLTEAERSLGAADNVSRITAGVGYTFGS